MDRARLSSDAGLVRRLVLFLGISALCGLLVAGLVLPVLGSLGLAARASAEGFQGMPAELDTPALPQRSRILAADGSLLANFYFENRISVPLSAVAPAMRQALVAIEDSRFYDHGGLDLRGTSRALVSNLSGRSVQGGSTLTQQYVKQVLVETAQINADRNGVRAAQADTIGRKLRELRYAMALEEKLTKDEILERYLNIAYFGGGAYGVEAASRHYFNRPASKLTTAQAATLAGLVQRPNALDPVRNPLGALGRRNTVLSRMADLGMIAPTQAVKLARTRLGLRVTTVGNGCESSRSPYFCDFVLRTIQNEKVFGATKADRQRLLFRGGLTIRTTLEPKRQKIAQAALEAKVPRGDRSGIATAIAMVEPGSGAIRVMTQNSSWGRSKQRGQTQVNYAADYLYGNSQGFQAGSTFKPFVLTAALQEGIPLSLRLPSPPRRTFTKFRNCKTGVRFPPYTAANSTSAAGTSSLLTGTWRSVNTFFVALEERVGLCAPFDMAAAMGVTPSSPSVDPETKRVPSFTLGTMEVSPLTMAEAYATFAARGVHCDSYAITSVTDRAGRKLPLPPRTCQPVMEPKIADAVNYVLAGVIDGPDSGRTGRLMTIGRPAGGKTGTTQNNYDVWFVGYTPDLSAAVWVGDPLHKRKLRNITIGGTYYDRGFGFRLPGPIWKAAMSGVLSGVPESRFVAPDRELVFGKRVPVPALRGRSVREAQRLLEEVGLTARIAERPVFSGRVPPGGVVFSSPSSGAEVYPGTEVTLYLSAGFRIIHRPDTVPSTPPVLPVEPAATRVLPRPKATAAGKPEKTCRPGRPCPSARPTR